jgi:hypothetical protein
MKDQQTLLLMLSLTKLPLCLNQVNFASAWDLFEDENIESLALIHLINYNPNL